MALQSHWKTRLRSQTCEPQRGGKRQGKSNHDGAGMPLLFKGVLRHYLRRRTSRAAFLARDDLRPACKLNHVGVVLLLYRQDEVSPAATWVKTPNLRPIKDFLDAAK
jgi:hypothetical protein